MRIVNFNGKTDTWIAWNKTYCYDLERQIVSLYDYLIYFNPDYVIFNSPTKEGALTNKEMEDAGYQKDIDNKTYFYPKKLMWRQGFYNNSTHGDGSIDLQDSSELIDFPAGFICIRNTNKEITSKKDLLILPIGNGGLYNFNVSYKDLVATFRANELNNFAKTFSFNLGSNLRYIYQSDNKKIDTSGSNINEIIYNQSGETNIVADKDGNLWTGGRDLMPILMHNGEDVFLDVEVSYNWRVVDSKSRAVLTILSNDKPPKIDIDVELF